MGKKKVKLRPGAQTVEVFNSGLQVWLYDAANREKLKASGAFEVETDQAEMEEKMKSFVREGTILAYDLMQDDSLKLAVIVGEPMAKKEMSTAPWLAPQRGFLRLPTGALVVESNDALTIRKLEPADKGALVNVPPGDYLATIHRIDYGALEADEDDYSGPSEVITLTPGDAAKPVEGQPPFLPWEPRPPEGDNQWRIEDGVYHGAVLFPDDEMAMGLAIDKKGVAQMGLKDRSLAVISVPEFNFECVVVFQEGDPSKSEFLNRMEFLKPSAALGGREWGIFSYREDSGWMFGLRQLSITRIPRKKQDAWWPATMRMAEGQALEKKRR